MSDLVSRPFILILEFFRISNPSEIRYSMNRFRFRIFENLPQNGNNY